MSKIEVNEIVNQSGDNDSGIDLTTNDQIGFKIANASKWTLNSSGNLFPASTSQGIVLGATSDTSANRLEDYEEGHISAPVVKVGGTVCTLGSTSGLYYTKIGRGVLVQVEFRISNYNGGSDETTVDLPFTAASGNYTTGVLRVYSGSVSGREFSTIQSNEAVLKFNINNDGGATTNYTPAINAYIYTSLFYITA